MRKVQLPVRRTLYQPRTVLVRTRSCCTPHVSAGALPMACLYASHCLCISLSCNLGCAHSQQHTPVKALSKQTLPCEVCCVRAAHNPTGHHGRGAINSVKKNVWGQKVNRPESKVQLATQPASKGSKPCLPGAANLTHLTMWWDKMQHCAVEKAGDSILCLQVPIQDTTCCCAQHKKTFECDLCLRQISHPTEQNTHQRHDWFPPRRTALYSSSSRQPAHSSTIEQTDQRPPPVACRNSRSLTQEELQQFRTGCSQTSEAHQHKNPAHHWKHCLPQHAALQLLAWPQLPASASQQLQAPAAAAAARARPVWAQSTRAASPLPPSAAAGGRTAAAPTAAPAPRVI